MIIHYGEGTLIAVRCFEAGDKFADAVTEEVLEPFRSYSIAGAFLVQIRDRLSA